MLLLEIEDLVLSIYDNPIFSEIKTAILEELKISKLTPVNELQRGVVRMKAIDLLITVKPGSYQLPEELLKHYFTK